MENAWDREVIAAYKKLEATRPMTFEYNSEPTRINGKGITGICHFYNEEFLLPWWLKHHKHIFDHCIMIDYASTDRSREIIREICPSWDLIPSRNAFFDPKLIDQEVMDMEWKVEGWRVTLNVTEFLYGNTDHLHSRRGNWTQYILPNYVFVDPRPLSGLTGDNLSDSELTYDKPLHEQCTWGYFAPEHFNSNMNNTPKRLNRSLHNFALTYPDWGRHFPDTDYTFDDLVIFYYGHADISKQGIARKMQIKYRIPPGKGASHHSISEGQVIQESMPDQQIISVDLSDRIRNIIEENKRVTGQEW